MALVDCRIPRICDERACLSMGGGSFGTFGGEFGLELTWCKGVSCVTVLRPVSSMTTCIVCGHPVAVSMLPSPSLKLIMIAFVDVSCFPP